MPRIRSAKNKNLPPYVRKRSSGYYLEPKSKMRELLGGKSSYPLGNSLSEMYCAYAKYMGALESRKKQSLYTMNDLFQKYIEKELHDNCKEHVKRMRTKLGFLIASFGEIPICMVTEEHVQRYKDIRDEDGLIASNRDLALLSSIFNKANKLGYKGHLDNPCKGVKRNPEKARKLGLSLEEFFRFYHYAYDRDPMLACYVYLLLICGRRGEEMIRLRKDGISNGGLMFEIVKKRAQDESIPERRLIETNSVLSMEFAKLNAAMENEAENRLRSAKGRNLPLQNPNRYFGDLNRGAMHKRVERMRNKALAEGVISVKFRCHDLRSVGASFLTLEEACKFLAHKDVSITKKYYWRGEERISALNLPLAD